MTRYGKLFETGLAGGRLDDVEVIDVHGHYGHCFQFNCPHYGAEDLLSEMDRVGVETLIFSSYRALIGDPDAGNRDVLEVCEKHPGRFLMYYVGNPHYAVEFDEKVLPYLDNPLVKGFKLHCEGHAYPLGGDAYMRVWELSGERGLPVLVHLLPERDMDAFVKIADDYPDAKLLFAHHGGPENLDKHLPMFKDKANIYVDTCVSLLPVGTMERLVDELGDERILFGSDMPYLNLGGQIGKVLLAKLSDDVKKKILAHNAKRWYGID